MKEGLINFTDTYLTLIGLVIFFVWFVVMLIWVLKITPQKQHQLMSMLPFENDEVGHE